MTNSIKSEKLYQYIVNVKFKDFTYLGPADLDKLEANLGDLTSSEEFRLAYSKQQNILYIKFDHKGLTCIAASSKGLSETQDILDLSGISKPWYKLSCTNFQLVTTKQDDIGEYNEYKEI